MKGRVGGEDPHARGNGRVCARLGCSEPVKKTTARYCSVRCCSIDPERRERLRASAQRTARGVLPMTRQLTLGLAGAHNPEAEIARIAEGREDVPRGMSHLCG